MTGFGALCHNCPAPGNIIRVLFGHTQNKTFYLCVGRDRTYISLVNDMYLDYCNLSLTVITEPPLSSCHISSLSSIRCMLLMMILLLHFFLSLILPRAIHVFFCKVLSNCYHQGIPAPFLKRRTKIF